VMTDPGDVELSEVEIAGPFVSGGSRAELVGVVNRWASQEGERFNATVTPLDSNQAAPAVWAAAAGPGVGEPRTNYPGMRTDGARRGRPRAVFARVGARRM